MKLDLERQPAGRSRLEIAGELDLNPLAGGPAAVTVSGDLQVDNLESRFLVSGMLTARGDAECDRCLARFALAYEVPVDIMIVRSVALDGDMGDTLVIQQNSGEVDLAEALREAVILGLPQVKLCRADCRGICAQCGADRNVAPCSCAEDEDDPRWEGLPD